MHSVVPVSSAVLSFSFFARESRENPDPRIAAAEQYALFIVETGAVFTGLQNGNGECGAAMRQSHFPDSFSEYR